MVDYTMVSTGGALRLLKCRFETGLPSQWLRQRMGYGLVELGHPAGVSKKNPVFFDAYCDASTRALS